jgi:hydroxyacylglutathione hydrolase
VLFIPGHTRGHIAFHFADSDAVFCGDTLFSIGCGRTFEGTAQQMWASLLKLRALPDKTFIYCGHEYTEANCRFALTVEPENRDLAEVAEAVKQARAQGDKTIPANLGIEKFCNPFLRADQPGLLAKFGGPARDPATAFGAIRLAKDNF